MLRSVGEKGKREITKVVEKGSMPFPRKPVWGGSVLLGKGR